jgi:ATP-binding cassette subfamily C (CFTR/MRP) protein 1
LYLTWLQIAGIKPPLNWPSGQIEFKNYSTRYREGLDLVLKGLSFSIKAKEKVGIVGRTGAGKSSLTLALFRLIEPSGGTIVLDGIDVKILGLHDLRSRLTIIPQDPVLFSGTIRENLDPTGVCDDVGLWRALESSRLKEHVEKLEGGLDGVVHQGGENFSQGQRQLICLARALLRKTNILLLDEATAAIDVETDGVIQETIRREFKECTILTIAHRIKTVLDYDRILVLDGGRVVELGAPGELLKKPNSVFRGLAEHDGVA